MNLDKLDLMVAVESMVAEMEEELQKYSFLEGVSDFNKSVSSILRYKYRLESFSTPLSLTFCERYLAEKQIEGFTARGADDGSINVYAYRLNKRTLQTLKEFLEVVKMCLDDNIPLDRVDSGLGIFKYLASGELNKEPWCGEVISPEEQAEKYYQHMVKSEKAIILPCPHNPFTYATWYEVFYPKEWDREPVVVEEPVGAIKDDKSVSTLGKIINFMKLKGV